MAKIINLKDIKEKKKVIEKRKMLYQGTKNGLLDLLKDEFDVALSEVQKSKKGDIKNGIAKE